MPDAPKTVDELYPALRLKRELRENESEANGMIEELDGYIELMTQYGTGTHDRVSSRPLEGGTEATAHLVVEWENPSDMWRAIRRNVNKSGVFIQTDRYPAMDSVVHVEIVIRQPAIRFASHAKVIWVNPQARTGRPMGVGVKYLWEDDERKGLFRQFVDAELDPVELNRLGGVS